MSASRPFAPHRFAPRAQRGAIIVFAAFFILIAVIMLGTIDIGHFFYKQRDLQKTADMAAIAGAQALAPTDCASATATARNNAGANGLSAPATGLAVTCGRWDPTGTTVATTPLPPDAFGPPVAGSEQNAVKIVSHEHVASFFGNLIAEGFGADPQPHAIATREPLAAFSVGTTLLRFDGDSTLGAILKGIGLDLSGTSLVGYEGLAQVKITPGGLLQALGIPVATDIGVGELNTLLAARQVSLGDLLNAVATVAGQGGLASANANLVNLIKAKLGLSTLNVQLGSLSDASRGLFAQIIAPDTAGHAALGVEVNALDLIGAAVGVATSKHAISAGINVANLAKAQVGIVEPPSVAIGVKGATAYTAQVRSYIHIDTGNIPLIGGLLGNVVRLNLPIVLDAVTGKGTLDDLCETDAQGKRTADISVDASILKVCVGGIDESNVFSTSQSCETNLQSAELLNVLGLIRVNTKLVINALPANGQVTLHQDETATVGNELLLGTTVRNITDAILGALLGGTMQSGQGIGDTGTLRTNLVTDIWNTTSGNRNSRATQTKAKITAATNGLAGFVSGLSPATVGILGNLLNLNVLGLLDNVGNLIGGLLGTLGDVLGALLGPCSNLLGSDSGCRAQIATGLAGSSGSGANQVPNAVTATTGFLFDLLQPLLDNLGSAVLTPVLQNILGLKLGLTDVTLQSLQCSNARLVY